MEYCVVITVPDMTDPIERSDFSVCVSTEDGTAMGKNNICMLIHVCFYWHHIVRMYDIIYMYTVW